MTSTQKSRQLFSREKQSWAGLTITEVLLNTGGKLKSTVSIKVFK